jgi:hypothetical protein
MSAHELAVMLLDYEMESFVLVKSRTGEKVLEAGGCMSLDREVEMTPDRRMRRLINALENVWREYGKKKMLEKYERSRYVFENK